MELQLQLSDHTSGRTYKVTLLGTAKDSNGNAIGSDVVKYFIGINLYM